MSEFISQEQLSQEVRSLDIPLKSGGTVVYAVTGPCILSKVHREFQTSTEYTPEQYDALVYESEYDATTITFKNGTVVTVDAVDTERAEQAVTEMVSVVDTICDRPFSQPTIRMDDNIPVPEDRLSEPSESNDEQTPTETSIDGQERASGTELEIDAKVSDWDLTTIEQLPATVGREQVESLFDEWGEFDEREYLKELAAKPDIADGVADPVDTNATFEIVVKRDMMVQKVDNQVSERKIPASEYAEREETDIPISEHTHPPIDTETVVEVVRRGDLPIECSNCDGEGKNTCDNCTGGSFECPNCSGSGDLTCDVCDGNSTVPCPSCNGSKKKSCPDCSNGKTNCESCNGSGMERCSDCRGSGNPPEHSELDVCPNCNGHGEVSCHACNGVKQYRCTTCNGTNEVSCNRCGQRGRVSCTNCGKDGLIQCRACDGDGSQECKKCSGKGYRECYRCNAEGSVVQTEVGEITYESVERTEIDSFSAAKQLNEVADEIDTQPISTETTTITPNQGTERQRINYSVFPVASIGYSMNKAGSYPYNILIAGVAPQLFTPTDQPMSTKAKIQRIGKYALIVSVIAVLALIFWQYTPAFV
ncbi:hypothetical protein [Natranaeroarchaeum sulfidigenes]|uniref:DnaJ-class molecular chaperone n=1 Tax=Natranaeroarchaeum sulfidigenes TaxID=2784880 RepID=A0A897MRY8_9EURY|nr:hypothetical protein [Natranaeroarchaeum sulfidigenes]QSG02798.1 DnaJ-class molecular chaperone [Natranaeroarchaeum sulfidigenes]